MKTTITAVTVAAALFASTTANAQLNFGAATSATLKTTAQINSGATNNSLHTTAARLHSATGKTINTGKEVKTSVTSAAKNGANKASELSNDVQSNTAVNVHSSHQANSDRALPHIIASYEADSDFETQENQSITPAVKHKVQQPGEKALQKSADLSAKANEQITQSTKQKATRANAATNSSAEVKSTFGINASQQ